MIERKQNNKTESAVGPIIVMIDASRLSHSLATALKDRPHGIPVQPNRSLPLRPPPPLPVRISLTKSPKNSPVTQANVTQKEKSRNCSGTNVIKNSTKQGNMRNNTPSINLANSGINFYDSKGEEEEDSNDKFGDNFAPKISKDRSKSRHSKSLDNDGSDGKTGCGDKRRKSFEHERIRHDSGDRKKRNISNHECARSGTKIVKKEKERRSSSGIATKRKSLNTEENSDLSCRSAKSPRSENNDTVNLYHSMKLKTLSSQNETRENLSKAKNFTGVESSGEGLPIIYKSRRSESDSPPLTDKNTKSKSNSDCDSMDKTNWQQTSSNTFQLILPKPTNIPKCPGAIPIKVAHAMNQGDLKNSNIHAGTNGTGITTGQISKVNGQTTNQSSSTNPKIHVERSNTHTHETVEEIENTLPSMPSLEDMMMQSDALLQDKLKLDGNEDGIEKAESNLAGEFSPMAEATVLQVQSDLTSKRNEIDANEIMGGNIKSINDQEFNKPHDSIVNLTTVLKIEIPGRSPELIILRAPQIMPNCNEDSIAHNSPVEATIPVSLASGNQPALGETRKPEESTKIDESSVQRKYRKRNQPSSEEKILQEKDTAEIELSSKNSVTTDHQQQCGDQSGKEKPQYVLQHKNSLEFEVRLMDTSESQETEKTIDKSEDDESTGEKEPEVRMDCPSRPDRKEIVRCRKIKLNLKLRTLYEEEENLKYKMSQTKDPSRLTRLQQKINCAKKKIENISKNFVRTISGENLGLYANPAPSRIKVRQDLVQEMPSPESGEPTPSRSPLRQTNETDNTLAQRRQALSPPPVITISESDSEQSDDETDVNNGKSPDNIKPLLQSDVEMKYEDKNELANETEVVSITGNQLPDDEVENFTSIVDCKMTNNNVEYLNKNLSPHCEDIAIAPNTASMSIPYVPASGNNESMRIPLVPASPNTDSMSIPGAVASPNTGSTSIPASPNTNSISSPRIPASPNTDLINISRVSSSGNTALLNIPPLIRDPINLSPNHYNGVVNRKSPSMQYGPPPNSNLLPDKFDKERSKAKHEVPAYLQGNSVAATNGTAKFDENIFIPTVVSDLRTPSTIRRTAIQEDINGVHPVPNYPVHRTDYATTGNAPGMFSRDNGGAHINLSSPLQGHSALPLPPTYRHATARGYPMPAELSPSHQTTQWHKQHPANKPSMQVTPDQDASSCSSILGFHLLNSQVQEPASFPSSNKLSSLAQSKEAPRTKPAQQPISNRIMAAQFPTLRNWAAQRTRDSVTKKPVKSPNSDGTGYKTTGSDMYKMTATAVNPTNPIHAANTIHWAPGRACPEQPRPISSYPAQRSMPQTYRRDYPLNPQVSKNPHNGPAGYPGSEVYALYPTNPYHQVAAAPQSTRSAEHSSGQLSHGQQNARQYQPPAPMRPLLPRGYQSQVNNPAQLGNSMGMMPQQYMQQQQQSQSYVQAMYSQWQSANNYHKNYISSQYQVQSKPMDNNSTAYRQTNKNLPPMQQPQYDNVIRQFIPNVCNVKLPNPMYNMPANLNAIAQDMRNIEPLDLGRSLDAPHLGKVHKGTDRSSTLQCSLCGMPGPKFNCLGCETAFYCNEHCQAQHWGAHFIECPKKMPKLKKVS